MRVGDEVVLLGTDAVEGQCCNFWCCSSEFDGFVANATARFDGGEGGGLSARLDRKCHWYDTPEECGGYRTCGIEYYCREVRRLDEVEEGEPGDEGRGRRALKGKAKEKCFELEPNGYECRPVDEGEYKEIAGVAWPASLFALIFPPAFAYLLYLFTFNCRVTSPLIAVFDEWKALGITTSFFPGAKHRRPALLFVVPALPPQLAAPQALGQPPPGIVVNAPPPGATPQMTPAGTGGTEVSVAVVVDPKKSLTDLKELFDAGIITQADFDSKKAELLARM